MTDNIEPADEQATEFIKREIQALANHCALRGLSNDAAVLVMAAALGGMASDLHHDENARRAQVHEFTKAIKAAAQLRDN